METVLIAGCGDVGTALGVRLAEDGHRVIGLRRSSGALPDCIEPFVADLSVAESLREMPTDVNVLYYAAAADAFEEKAYRRAYVEGLRNVLEALGRSPLRRAFFVSSTGVYGIDDGRWVDESSPTCPAGFSGEILLEAERMLAHRGIDATAVRFGGIYGPGRERLIEGVRAGAGCDDTPLWTNRIHREDCVGMLHHLFALDAAADVYIGVDCEPAPQCRVMDWLASRLGLDAVPRRAGETRRRGGNKRCSNRRILDSGYRFAYPSFREGYAELISGPRRREAP